MSYEVGGKCARGHDLTEETLKVKPGTGYKYCRVCEREAQKKRHKARMKSDPEYRDRYQKKKVQSNRRYRQRRKLVDERIAKMVLSGEIDLRDETVDQRALRIVEARRAANELTVGAEVDLTSTLVRPSAKKQWDAFQNAMRDLEFSGIDWNCKDRWNEFALYSDENAPTAQQAQEMCAGCPLLELCDAYATAQREIDGVWGGKQRRKLEK